MDSNLVLSYIVLLIILLSGAAFFVLRQAFKTRRMESTMNKLQKKVSAREATAKDYYELGSIYLDKRLFAQAVGQLQQALKNREEMEPENVAIIYNALGYGYVAQEQYDMALRQYKSAVKAFPEYATAWNNLAFAYEKKQLISQALEAYENVLAIEPGNSVAKRRAGSLRKRVAPPAPSEG
ncbi:MAG: tetratricopeptide repeat protein [Cyanobacteria bacterium P01_F01_bin.153]